MKKLLIITIIILTLGCTHKKEEITISELVTVKNQIIEKVHETNYKNFSSCSIKANEKIIVVELHSNTKEEQEWFKNNIVDSKYIKFMEQ